MKNMQKDIPEKCTSYIIGGKCKLGGYCELATENKPFCTDHTHI